MVDWCASKKNRPEAGATRRSKGAVFCGLWYRLSENLHLDALYEVSSKVSAWERNPDASLLREVNGAVVWGLGFGSESRTTPNHGPFG